MVPRARVTWRSHHQTLAPFGVALLLCLSHSTTVQSMTITNQHQLHDLNTLATWLGQQSRILLQTDNQTGESASGKGQSTSDAAASHKQTLPADREVQKNVATLADTLEDKYWLNRSTDTQTCSHGVRWASRAQVLQHFTDPAPSHDCRVSCRQTLGCNAWFWCGETKGGQCHDWQSRKTIGAGECLLLVADQSPRRMPKQRDITDSFKFTSYHTGNLKGAMFLRPPEVVLITYVTTCDPQQSGRSKEYCRYTNWLNQLSIMNKHDHARLRGYEFILEALPDGQASFEVLRENLNRLANVTSIQWVLWMDIRAIVYKHDMSFPVVSKYERRGQVVAMYGRHDKLDKGYVWGFEPGVMLLSNSDSARSWLDEVYTLEHDKAAMAEARKGLNAEHGIPYFTAMAALLKANRSLVAFEHAVCFACYWSSIELEAPTGFAAYFSGVNACNMFSLAKDEPGDKNPFNKELLSMIRLASCKHARMLDMSNSSSLAEGLDAKADRIHMQAFVIVPGAFNLKKSATECRKQCQDTHGCNAWMFCWRRNGCDDGHVYRPEWYPYQACELYSLPHNLPLDAEGKGPMFSSASHGFLPKRYYGSKRFHPAALTQENAALRLPKGRAENHPNVIIATAVPADACGFPVADYINKLGVSNKHDYAHRHSFELHISAEMIDPNVTAGNWNKLTMMRRVLDATPPDAAEWVMWMDSDTVFFNMSLLPRFDAYEGRNLVLWGQEEKLKEGDLNQGLNTGVMMFRNNDWSRKYLADVGQYAYMPKADLKEKMLPVLEKEIFPLVSGFYDTPFFVWLLKVKQEYFEKAFFEDQISFNRHWLSFEFKSEDVPALVIHYAGCTICHPPQNKLTDATTSACAKEFFKAYAYSRCKLAEDLLGYPTCTYHDDPETRALQIRLGQ